MKLNKGPGIDGLTVEFYRTFWPFLKHFAVKVFNNCYVKEELSNTQKIGLISLIYKKKMTHLAWIIIAQLLFEY